MAGGQVGWCAGMAGEQLQEQWHKPCVQACASMGSVRLTPTLLLLVLVLILLQTGQRHAAAVLRTWQGHAAAA